MNKGFFERVYQVVRKIPPGKVTTYGEVARLLQTKDARRVGHALHANPSHQTPCHRVVFAGGSLAPEYAFGGPKEQRRKLELEGITFDQQGRVNLTQHAWKISGEVVRNRISLEKSLLGSLFCSSLK